MNIPRSVLVFGSSTAYGKNDIEGGGFTGRLRRWHEEVEIGNKTYNLGVPGATIEYLMDRLQMESKHRSPDLLLLQLGCNDAMRDGSIENDPATPIDEYRAKFAELLNSLVAIAPTIVVSIFPIQEEKTTPVSWRDGFFLNDDIAAYEKVMRDETLRAGLDYVDIWGDWTNMGDHSLFMSDDGMHANSAGHEYIFEKVRDKIMANFGGNQ